MTWRAAHELGLAIEIHCIPHYAVAIRELANKFPGGHAGIGSPARPRGDTVNMSSFQTGPFGARVYGILLDRCGIGVEGAVSPCGCQAAGEARVQRHSGPGQDDRGRMGWKYTEFHQAVQLFDLMFDFVPEMEREKIRGLNAKKLFIFREGALGFAVCAGRTVRSSAAPTALRITTFDNPALPGWLRLADGPPGLDGAIPQDAVPTSGHV